MQSKQHVKDIRMILEECEFDFVVFQPRLNEWVSDNSREKDSLGETKALVFLLLLLNNPLSPDRHINMSFFKKIEEKTKKVRLLRHTDFVIPKLCFLKPKDTLFRNFDRYTIEFVSFKVCFSFCCSQKVIWISFVDASSSNLFKTRKYHSRHFIIYHLNKFVFVVLWILSSPFWSKIFSFLWQVILLIVVIDHKQSNGRSSNKRPRL